MNSKIRFQGGGKPVTIGFATPQVHRKDKPDGAVNDALGSVNPADPKNDQETGSKRVEGANKRPKD
jgi:hypothetical protein